MNNVYIASFFDVSSTICSAILTRASLTSGDIVTLYLSMISLPDSSSCRLRRPLRYCLRRTKSGSLILPVALRSSHTLSENGLYGFGFLNRSKPLLRQILRSVWSASSGAILASYYSVCSGSPIAYSIAILPFRSRAYRSMPALTNEQQNQFCIPTSLLYPRVFQVAYLMQST